MRIAGEELKQVLESLDQIEEAAIGIATFLSASVEIEVDNVVVKATWDGHGWSVEMVEPEPVKVTAEVKEIDLRHEANEGRDARESMEFGVFYRRLDPGKCSFCRDGVERTDLSVIKEEASHRSMGVLRTMCPAHRTYRESLR